MKFIARTKGGAFRETFEAPTIEDAAQKAVRKLHRKKLSVLRSTGNRGMSGYFQGYRHVSTGLSSSYGEPVLVDQYVPGASGETVSENRRRAKGQLRVRLGKSETAALATVKQPGEDLQDTARRVIHEYPEKCSASEKSTRPTK